MPVNHLGNFLKCFLYRVSGGAQGAVLSQAFRDCRCHQLEESKDSVQCGYFMDVEAEAHSVRTFVQGDK